MTSLTSRYCIVIAIGGWAVTDFGIGNVLNKSECAVRVLLNAGLPLLQEEGVFLSPFITLFGENHYE